MSIVQTRPWPEIAERLKADKSPYLPLVQFIMDSDFSSEIHGGVFLSGLLISDTPGFDIGKHMLQIEITYTGFRFSYMRGPGYEKDNSIKEVPFAEAVETLDLFLKVKFGLNLKLWKVT